VAVNAARDEQRGNSTLAVVIFQHRQRGIEFLQALLIAAAVGMIAHRQAPVLLFDGRVIDRILQF